jgi:putative chitinase
MGNPWTPAPTWDAVLNQGQVLKQGHQGPSVAELQKLLGIGADGFFGSGTRTSVEAFQRSAKIDPSVETAGEVGKLTLQALLVPKTLSPPPATGGGLSVEQLRAIMTRLPETKAASYLPPLNSAMTEADITTPKRQAAFLAQLAHESGELHYWAELADGTAYEGRKDLGNTQPGDGPRYKGRGPIQITGRNNYRAAGQALGIDLENHPERASEPDVGFRTATWFWTSRKLNALADAGDFKEITHRINGGYNGLAQREEYYARALRVLQA